ncbi:MAG: hypothetical protein JNM55_07105 [Anaerolineales bacterium]|nr:hypothetical protein [Anaerolineales bacterium]
MYRTKYYERIENEIKNNKACFSAYLDFIEKDTELSIGSRRGYLSKVTPFVKYLDKLKTPIEDITSIEIIEQYAKEENKDIDPGFISALSEFFSVARNIVNVKITDEEIRNIQKTESTSPRSASPLSILEIIQIRNKLRKENDYKLLFIFEMFFTQGLELDQFQQIASEDFSINENRFYSPTGVTKVLGKALIELLTTHSDLPEAKVRGTIQGHIRKIGELIESINREKRDKLIWQDIMETRDKYFPLCPECEEKYPNTEDFWVLLEHQFDESKTRWLLCGNCAKKRVSEVIP